MVAHSQEALSAVPLLSAVFCVDCEHISNSPHEACTICGSRSLVSLFRVLGGTLRKQRSQLAAGASKVASYNLELTARVREIPASELTRVIEALGRLSEVGAELELLRVIVESVLDTEDASRAA